jgi:hypothetical protein
MRKLFVPAVLVVVAVVLAAVLFAVNSGLRIGYANESMTVHVVEHAITDTVVNVGRSTGDALGNQLVFHNPVYDAADKNQVGHDNGNCVRTVLGKVWECYWTTFLAGGQITVEGPYYDNGTDSRLAITGGTDIYREAHGQMLLHARGNPVGSEYDFIFYLN